MKYPVLAALAIAAASIQAADEPKNATSPSAPTPPKELPVLTPEQIKQAWSMLGYSVASRSDIPKVKSQLNLSDEEIEYFIKGIRQLLRGEEPEFKHEEFGPSADAMFQERFKAAAGSWGKKNDEFLSKLDADKSITKTESGLRYKIINPGSDLKPTSASTVKCRYEGKLIDGKVFDSTKRRNNEPTEFPLSGVIPAWKEGLQLIGIGGKIMLYCPSSLAYGEEGQGPIPGHSTLQFEVELVEISKAK